MRTRKGLFINENTAQRYAGLNSDGEAAEHRGANQSGIAFDGFDSRSVNDRTIITQAGAYVNLSDYYGTL